MAKQKKTESEFSPDKSTPRELVVVAKRDAGMRTAGGDVFSTAEKDTTKLQALMTDEAFTLTPLFGQSEDALLMQLQSENNSSEEDTNMHLYYHVEAPDEKLETIQKKLLKNDMIDGAYIKPKGEPPIAPDADMSPPENMEFFSTSDDGAPATPPDFRNRQIYLNAAPAGIDARYAWTKSGGRGKNVRIIDLEWGWEFNHVDLKQNQGGLLSGTNATSTDHGTAVLGEYSGDISSLGIEGICPEAWAAAVAFSQPSARAIRIAADRLRPGDIMLLEIHRAGPRHNFQARNDQSGYIAVEWWPDDYEAIRYAVNKGVIVVEAAGNGGQDFDDAIYDTKPSGFPSWWKNPFNRNTLDSGAVLVGAGAPPPGTHGRNHGTDRSRLSFSNYGAAVDCQAWGREVTTTGYGDLWRDPSDLNNKDKWFTDTFSGTSSASPIVVGALGCVQGYLRARGRVPLTPARARALLRSTGSPQQSTSGRPATQRIGNRPNLRQMIREVSKNRTFTGAQFNKTLAANQTMRFFTHSWPAHWHVLWTVVPTTTGNSGAQIKYDVQVQRKSDKHITYFIKVTNLTNQPVGIQGRYGVLGW